MNSSQDRRADVQVPHPTAQNLPSAAPPTVAAPKQTASELIDAPTDAVVDAVTELGRPSSRTLLPVGTAFQDVATEVFAEAAPGAALVVQAPAASSVRPPSDAEALVEASAAPAKTESVATSLPASIDIDASLRQAFTARPVREQIQLLNRIADTMSPVIGAYIRALFRHPPIILGQSAAEYYELVTAALGDLIPHDFNEVIVLKQIVDEQWKILTFSGVQGSLLRVPGSRARRNRVLSLTRRRIHIRVLNRSQLYRLIDEAQHSLVSIIRQRVEQLPALQDFQQLLRRCTARQQPLQVKLHIGIMEVALRKCPQDLLEHGSRG